MDFLPEVKMDFIPSDDESINPDSDGKEEENPNMQYEDEKKVTIDEDANEEEIIVEPVKKSDSINPEEIFSFNEEEKKNIQEQIKEVEPNVKLTKKGKPFKKRPPMSEAHKLKLKAAREKAMATRKAKAAARKEDKLLEKKNQELLRTKKKKEVEKLEKEVNDELPTPKPSPQGYGVDVEKAVLDGIAKYEVLRKQRKKEKQESQKKEKEENEMKEKLRRAIAPQKPFNPYANCY
tara:strand:+ start:481 stop:1185 length:705 start_codon:yes stop_codon:yes gene_type:complete